MATGVLTVFLGEATKLCDLLPNQDKGYTAQFQLGTVTDTQDRTGRILSQNSLPISREMLAEILPRFTGDICQLPPMYSAVQVGGRRLYDLAREGAEIERTPRRITVYSLKLTSYDELTRQGILEIRCSKGSFVRTIVHDIGQALDAAVCSPPLEGRRPLAFYSGTASLLTRLPSWSLVPMALKSYSADCCRWTGLLTAFPLFI